MATMTNEEKVEWDKLYQYVRCNTLGYSKDMALPNYMVLRLKGMTDGKFMANKSTKRKGRYDYKIIRLTFVFCNNKIQKALRTKSFDTEQQKFNYICAIIQNNINDFVIRYNNAIKSKQEAEKQIEKIDIDTSSINNKRSNVVEKPSNDSEHFKTITKDMW